MGLGDSPGGLSTDYLVRLLADHSQMVEESTKALRAVADRTKETTEVIDKDLAGSILGVAAKFGVLAGAAFKAFDFIVKGLGKAVSLAANFVAQGVEMNATLETLMISFVNITGSEEAAVALMDRLRDISAKTGQNFEQLAKTTRRLTPFAQGNVDILEDMLTLSNQLAILDPVAGARGAGRALTEAFSGNILSLSRIFELPRSKLNELQAEFRETEDIEAFVAAISEVVAEAGVAAGDIEAFGNTFKGFVGRITAEFKELKLILGAPLTAVATEQMEDFLNLMQANNTELQAAALRIGAMLAVTLEVAVEAGIALAGIIQNFLSLAALADEIIRVVGNQVLDATVTTITAMVSLAVDALNVIIQEANKVANFLGTDEISEKEFDASAFETRFRESFQSVVSTASAAIGPLGELGKTLEAVGEGLDLKGRVAAFEEEFKNLLDINKEGNVTLGGENSGFREEDLSEWIEYVQEIRDVMEKHQKALEAETEKHQEKLLSIDQKANDRRAEVTRRAARRRADLIRDSERDVSDARIDLARKLADIDFDAQEDRVELERDVTRQVEEIDEQHAENIRRIRLGIQRQLFDAVNARDARRVFDILQKAREGTRESGRDRNKRLRELKVETKDRLQEIDRRSQIERAKAEQNFRQNLEDIARRREERLEDLNLGLVQELADIEEARLKQRRIEQIAHIKRMNDLNRQTQERLNLVGRSWAEEGKITAQGVNQVLDIVDSVFGGNGSYIGLIRGFNAALAGEAATTRAILASMGGEGSTAPTTSTGSRPKIGPRGLRPESGIVGAFGDRLFAADGLEGIIREPTEIVVGERGPEAVSITPLNRLGADQGADESTIRILVDASSQFSRQFEASLASQISAIVGNSVMGRRRTRRR